MKEMRLDKFLADMGQGTRKEVKKLIRQGAVTVNGTSAKKPEDKVAAGRDEIVCRGRRLTYEENIYYMLNKPAGFVSATEDGREKTVLDLLPEDAGKDLFPVGRLDKDTEGLLILTNDGPLAHRLLSPKKHVDKVYFVRADGCLTEEDVKEFASGMDIGDEKPALPAELKILKAGPVSEAEVTLREGRFHQVKRMFEKTGKPVLYLKRISMGGLKLDEELKKGEYRRLTPAEVEMLTGKSDGPNL